MTPLERFAALGHATDLLLILESLLARVEALEARLDDTRAAAGVRHSGLRYKIEALEAQLRNLEELHAHAITMIHPTALENASVEIARGGGGQ